MNPSFNRICLERFSVISQSQRAPNTFTTSHQKKLLKPFLRQSFLQNKAAIKKSEPQVDHFSNFTIFFYSSEKIKAKKISRCWIIHERFFSMLWHTSLKFNFTELQVLPLSINIIKVSAVLAVKRSARPLNHDWEGQGLIPSVFLSF